ncbi:c-type cytochrome [Undibacterium sp. LX40W]|uniref:C-type cytochrome n=1 Tax=Undibacterium nitidum TaxID=2762298 RepID=A0A923HLC9_9BURK|nr:MULTISPECIES: cytochrome c [Undibacterium]MBC3881509.1 c-type cytochrome [Undibacterium nitidum]MBC3891709.1 c-type cytochrome [Undibacterium sp. LX40W]
MNLSPYLRIFRGTAVLLASVLSVGALLPNSYAFAQNGEPSLEIKQGDKSQTWSRAALLAQAQTIAIAQDSAYKRPMRYQAVAMSKLMPNAAQYETIQFVASDGFVANIAGKDVAGKGQAYIAIESEQQPWPPIDANNPQKTASAGPFYLVWFSPEAGKISSEQWPYQVVKISVEQPLTQRFPQMVPKPSPSATYAQALKGLQVYVKNCAVCHTLNGGGDASIGPDLNQPYSPTAYFQKKFLRKLIRQPSSVRAWKTSLMPGFDEKTISPGQLDDLLVYLKHMAAAK